MDDLPIQKIQISGPTLASILHRFSSSSGDFDGLLFGRVTHVTPSSLSDDPSTSGSSFTSDSPSLIATVTSFISFPSTNSFYSPSGHLNVSLLRQPHFSSSVSSSSATAATSLIGWIAGRRKTPLRPSMRESMVSSSLSSSSHLSFSVPISPRTLTLTPSLFLVLTTPFHDQLIHTIEYRAFQFRLSSDSFEPKTVDIVNIGPAFRGHYGSFSPHTPFPQMPFEISSLNSMSEDPKSGEDSDTLKTMKRMSEGQKELDFCAEGFDIGRLSRLMGSEATSYTSELEDLYEKMLAKLDSLSRMVENTSASVLEKESQNMKLRYKIARLE